MAFKLLIKSIQIIKIMRRLILIPICFCFIQLTGQTINSGEYIAVIGKASDNYVPDMLTFNLDINTKDKKQKDAVQKLTDQAEKTIAIISRLGYDTKKVKLSTYNLGETFDYSGGKTKSNGYEASLSLELEIKYNEHDFNVFTDSITTNRIPDLNFTFQTSFSDSLRDVIKKELIAKASNDAENIARILAKSRNVTLGDIFSIEYTDNNFSLYGQGVLPPPPPPPSYAADRMEAPKISKSISMKGISTRQEVRIIYRIQPDRKKQN
jgi:uncharacterized protein YggE